MENLEFGLTLTILGMGGTLFILFLIGLVVNRLNKILLRCGKKEEGRG